MQPRRHFQTSIAGLVSRTQLPSATSDCVPNDERLVLDCSPPAVPGGAIRMPRDNMVRPDPALARMGKYLTSGATNRTDRADLSSGSSSLTSPRELSAPSPEAAGSTGTLSRSFTRSTQRTAPRFRLESERTTVRLTCLGLMPIPSRRRTRSSGSSLWFSSRRRPTRPGSGIRARFLTSSRPQ